MCYRSITHYLLFCGFIYGTRDIVWLYRLQINLHGATVRSNMHACLLVPDSTSPLLVIGGRSGVNVTPGPTSRDTEVTFPSVSPPANRGKKTPASAAGDGGYWELSVAVRASARPGWRSCRFIPFLEEPSKDVWRLVPWAWTLFGAFIENQQVKFTCPGSGCVNAGVSL